MSLWMKSFSVLTLSFLCLEAIAASSVSGVVTLKNKGKARGSLKEVIVYFVGKVQPPPKSPAILGQKDEAFQQNVLAVTKGQKLIIQNNDKISHNIFSNSPAKIFDLGLFAPGENQDIKFNKTGVVQVYCNIHPDMASTVLVLPNALHAGTDKNGKYKISNIPAGKYKIFAWHPLGRPKSKKIVIKDGDQLNINWELEITRTKTPHKNKKGRDYKKGRRKY
jgi:hypothetical protein